MAVSTPTPTFYPSRLTEELAARSNAETRTSFDKIVADMAAPAAGAATKRSSKPKKRYITVLVDMPHVKKYGKESTMSLTYGCSFVIEVGDKVLCPPTRLNSKWTTGVVTDLEANGYRGPVKYVAAFGAKKKTGGTK